MVVSMLVSSDRPSTTPPPLPGITFGFSAKRLYAKPRTLLTTRSQSYPQRLVAPGLSALLVSLIAGCSGSGGHVHELALSPGVAVVARGDWDDVRAAVIAAAGRNELAVLRFESPEPDTVVAMLRSVADEPGLLTVRLGDGNSLTLDCSIGRFGNAEAEARFLQDLARRLGDLRGVGAAPLRD